jgi:prepilin-type N-terminal cleavage/methylation domain-containing protein
LIADPRPHRRISGFTLLEMIVALAIFSVIGYTLTMAVDSAGGSHEQMLRSTKSNKALRRSSAILIDELRTSSDATVTVTALVDGNSELTFMMPIDVGGVFDWGVWDRSLGPDPVDQNMPGWSIRYTVSPVVLDDGTLDRQLVRQVRDDLGAIYSSQVIVHDLRDGAVAPAGFSVQQNGALWRVTITQQDHSSDGMAQGIVFDVQAQN